MRYCERCHVTVAVPRKHCPLCQNTLTQEDKEKPQRPVEAFPVIRTYYQQFNLFFRILLFLSIVASGVCVFLNILMPEHGWWSLIVVAGIVYMWLAVVTAVKKRKNISKNILYQIVFVGGLIFALDYWNGWHHWSVNYVIPALCTATMLAIAVLAKIRRTAIHEYAVYMLANAVLALVPLVLFLTGVVTVSWPSLGCVVVCVLLLAGFWIFGGLNAGSELRRRFHL